MRTSPAGVATIAQREGVVLHTYLDSVGIATCCCGHTGRTSPPVPEMGQKFTQAQCNAFLAADLAPVEKALNNALKVPVTQPQWDACISLGFNIGSGGLVGSTVVHMINAGNIQGAANAFLMWDHPAELLGRRKAERAQFLAPDTSTSTAKDV